jgi:4-amino-4-deoxy-L-arabinose transferase-like glycosyltransferase
VDRVTDEDPDRRSDTEERSLRHFGRWLLLPVGVATLIQVVYLWHIHNWAYHNGDASYYFFQAKYIKEGYWFIDPYSAGYGLGIVPSASHPPLTTLVLAASDVLGANSWAWHQAVMAALFVSAVAICGLVGRRLAGDLAGIVVALVVATYPYLWVNPGAVLSETVEILVVALLLWAGLRFWSRPLFRTAVEIGIYLGLAALTRSELILLTLLIGIPLVLLCRGLSASGRIKNLAVMVLALIVVIGPWVGRNMTTFHHVEYLSSEGGVTLATANCDYSYYGPNVGWWGPTCDIHAKFPPHADESDKDKVLRHIAETYIKDHESRLPTVVGIRVLRAWDLFRPFQQAKFDELDDRPTWASDAGIFYFYCLVPFAIAGAVILRRRRALLFPLISLIVTATIASAIIYANGRYRAEGDLAVAILGGVGFAALLDAGLTRFRSAHEAPVEAASELAG